MPPLVRQVPGPGWAWALGGAAVAYGAGFASGAAAEPFLVGRVRLRPDPLAREPLGRLPGRGLLVMCHDGVRLQAEEAGDPDAAVTVVLVHGYTQDMTSWHFQRRDLAADARVVLYDLRGHGRSGYGASEHATIDQLGADLAAVLEAAAPRGPVVLVGHSLGGMTVMALADSRPELFGTVVSAVCLVTTSAGELETLTFGLPARLTAGLWKAAPVAVPVAHERAELVTFGRELVSDVAFLATRRLSFGGRGVSPSLVTLVERAGARVPLEVLTDFFGTFVDHDKTEALPVLGAVPTTVVGAARDRVVPLEHARIIADAVPRLPARGGRRRRPHGDARGARGGDAGGPPAGRGRAPGLTVSPSRPSALLDRQPSSTVSPPRRRGPGPPACPSCSWRSARGPCPPPGRGGDRAGDQSKVWETSVPPSLGSSCQRQRCLPGCRQARSRSSSCSTTTLRIT